MLIQGSQAYPTGDQFHAFPMLKSDANLKKKQDLGIRFFVIKSLIKFKLFEFRTQFL